MSQSHRQQSLKVRRHHHNEPRFTMEQMEDRRMLSAISTASNPSTPFSGTPIALPAVIQAENFDNGGEGAGYYNPTPGNFGGKYRSTDVAIESTSDAGGGYDVGWITPGERLNYTVSIATPGTYTFSYRVADNGPGGTFHMNLDAVDVTGPLVIPNTGGWQKFTTINSNTVTLPAGVHVLTLVADSYGAAPSFGNVNWFQATYTGTAVPLPPATPPGTPFGGTAPTLPALIQAENFDNGGEGIGFHKVKPAPVPAAFRGTAVYTETTGDTGGGYDVGYINPGDWLAYTVNAAAGLYNFGFRVACFGNGGTFHMTVDGTTATGELQIPNTMNWQNYVTVTANNIALTAGSHVLKIIFDSNGSSGGVGNLNWIQATPGGTLTAPTGPTGLMLGTVTPTSVALSWTNTPGSTQTSVTVERMSATDDAFDPLPAGTGLAATATSFVDSTAVPGTPYAYEVISSNGQNSMPSNIVNVVTPTSPTAPPPPGSPYLGVIPDMTSVIQAENFDNGGEGIGYNKSSYAPVPTTYRNTEVFIQPTTDTGGGYNIGYTQSGDWLAYTVSAPTTGFYKFSYRVASGEEGGTFHMEIDGVNVTGPVIVPYSGGWQNWVTVFASGIKVTAGIHVIHIQFDTYADGDDDQALGNLNWFQANLVTATS